MSEPVTKYAAQEQQEQKIETRTAFRGYEDWAVATSARTDEVLTVIVDVERSHQ